MNTPLGEEYHDIVREASGGVDTSPSPERAKGRGRPRKDANKKSTTTTKTKPKKKAPEPTESPETASEDAPGQTYDFFVISPSGATQPVLTQAEAEYYEDRRDRYLADHRFTSVTDFQDLDRILGHELMLQRYDVWLTTGVDYFGQAVMEKDLLKYVKDLNATLLSLKKSMGLDKASRDKDKGADFVAWHSNALKRAKEFVIMRNKQSVMAITLMHEIFAKIQTLRNADAIERDELGLHPDEVLDWIWEDVKKRFDSIDEEFRNNPDGQRYWIGQI